jgi:hypothetical protein
MTLWEYLSLEDNFCRGVVAENATGSVGEVEAAAVVETVEFVIGEV